MHSNLKIVFLFSGQGSQYRGMGRKLFEQNAVFRNALEQTDSIVQKHLSRSLINELYNINQPIFDDLLITHPAIVAVEIAMYKVLQSMSVKPDYVVGNSLGEFAAAVVSGIWSAETAIEAAIEQARAIVHNNITGGMLAVIHQKTKDVEDIYLKHNLFLAADNFDGHFTVSGTVQDLDAFQAELNKLNIQFLRLPVAVPFHSPLMEGGRNGFIYYMNNVSFLSETKSGFISGIKYEALNELPEDYFWNVVSKYTNFSKLVNYIEIKGPCLYIDLGPSGTSATFVKYNLTTTSSSQTFQIMTPFKREEQQLELLKKLMPTTKTFS